MENPKTEYFDFENIKELVNKIDPTLFSMYLKEIFKDISERNNETQKKMLSRIKFVEYMKIPLFIAEKLFASFDKDDDGLLNIKEFSEGMLKLYLGNFEDSAQQIFNLLDFDKDSLIQKGDVKVLLSYLPLKTDHTKIEYKYQMESLAEIDYILDATFSSKTHLNWKEYLYVIENVKSDIFIQVLCFLLQKKPFTEQNINYLKGLKRRSSEIVEFHSPQINKRLPSPSRKSVLSPAGTVLNLVLNKMCGKDEIPKFDLNADEDDKKGKIGKHSSFSTKEDKGSNLNLGKRQSFIDAGNIPLISGMKGMIRMTNQKVTSLESLKSNQGNTIENSLKTSKNVFESPTNFFKKSKQAISEFNLEDNLIMMNIKEEDETKESNNNTSSTNESPIYNEEEEDIKYENWIYKLSESLKLKKFWLVVSGKDIYYYKDNNKEELIGMHNLSGSFIKEEGEKKIQDQLFYCFSIYFNSRVRSYYLPDKQIAKEWTANLKKAVGYQNFFEIYEMLDDLGEGKFGLVKLGVHKRTKERVAIKIIKKEAMNSTDLELCQSEIDIMKLVRHPNIVRLLDHFENTEYIFIVMELVAGGNLGNYLINKKFRLTEARAAEIMYQIGEGINYLHHYGIVHRDLKPDNILLTESSDKGQIKIMDFGLSKILGPLERAADGFGTLTFVAPEVLVRKPYNNQIDIWSMGVITYYMLSGLLPFDDDNDDEEVIAKRTVYIDVEFPGKVWGKYSDEVVDLIRKCLVKDPDKRIKIGEFLNHEWFKVNYSKKIVKK